MSSTRREGRLLRLAGIAAECLPGLPAVACVSIGPRALDQTRLQYDEVVKCTREEQLRPELSGRSAPGPQLTLPVGK